MLEMEINKGEDQPGSKKLFQTGDREKDNALMMVNIR